MIKQLDIKTGVGVGIVYSSLKVGNRAFLGGTFTTINSQSRPRFAVINLESGELDEVTHNFDGVIFTIKQISSEVIAIGGGFKNIDGQPNLYLTLYNITTDTFTPLLPDYSVANVGTPPPSVGIRAMEYHASSNYLWAGGQFFISNGTSGYSHLFGIEIETLTKKTIATVTGTLPPITQVGVIQSMTMNQSTGILYMSVYDYPNFLKSFDVSDPDNISGYTWAPTSTGPGLTMQYDNSRVFVSCPYSSTINGLSVNNFNPLATNAVTGASITSPNLGLMKQEFIGDTRVNQIIFNNDRIYVCGAFTKANITNIAADRVDRFSFSAFDSTTFKPVGDKILFSTWSTIYYIPPTPFQSYQPPQIFNMLVEDNYVHLFGAFRSIDGTAWTYNHYTVDTNGKRIQTKYLFAV